jgi:hypothetical protein
MKARKIAEKRKKRDYERILTIVNGDVVRRLLFRIAALLSTFKGQAMIQSARIRGVLAPVVTPFKADLAPDKERFTAQIRFRCIRRQRILPPRQYAERRRRYHFRIFSQFISDVS